MQMVRIFVRYRSLAGAGANGSVDTSYTWDNCVVSGQTQFYDFRNYF